MRTSTTEHSGHFDELDGDFSGIHLFTVDMAYVSFGVRETLVGVRACRMWDESPLSSL